MTIRIWDDNSRAVCHNNHNGHEQLTWGNINQLCDIERESEERQPRKARRDTKRIAYPLIVPFRVFVAIESWSRRRQSKWKARARKADGMRSARSRLLLLLHPTSPSVSGTPMMRGIALFHIGAPLLTTTTNSTLSFGSDLFSCEICITIAT